MFALCLLLSLGVRALVGQVENDSSTLHQATGVIGTSVSGVFLYLIGTIELVSILADQLGIDSGPLAWIAGLNLNDVGFAIVGLFILTWIVALAVWLPDTLRVGCGEVSGRGCGVARRSRVGGAGR